MTRNLLDPSSALSEDAMDYVSYAMAYTIPMSLDVWVLHGEVYLNLVETFRILKRSAGN